MTERAQHDSKPHVPGTVHEPVVGLQPAEQMATSQLPVVAPFWFCQPLRHRQSPAITQNPLTQPACVEHTVHVGPDQPDVHVHWTWSASHQHISTSPNIAWSRALAVDTRGAAHGNVAQS